MSLGACGAVYANGAACKGKLQRITSHVGECDQCGRYWWVRRASKWDERQRVQLPAHGPEVLALHELVREIRGLDGSVDRLYDQLREARRQRGAA